MEYVIAWLRNEWTELREHFAEIVENYRERNVCGFDLVTSIPPARSLTPRTISRAKDRKGGR